MPKIKTREKVQGIKTLDKAAVAGERMKEYISVPKNSLQI